ncbi:hypothetical protein COLO4_27124 [Corchorus olitorius]|uniref:Uncharacterized protein n=1 Tax=Corchorus olitorius TaxID=93759 RepID=A0A1R3HT38_9ROSI|nr:hypothetical protein COLO4_27124 [Corchorus olitorius]
MKAKVKRSHVGALRLEFSQGLASIIHELEKAKYANNAWKKCVLKLTLGQTKNEKDNDHDKPFAENIQGSDLNKIPEDESMDYNPDNQLNEENSGHDQVVTNGGCDGSIMQ